MPKKSEWEKRAEEAVKDLEKAKLSFSRAGLYLTSLLLTEVVRVGTYELATQLKEHKEYLSKKKGNK